MAGPENGAPEPDGPPAGRRPRRPPPTIELKATEIPSAAQPEAAEPASPSAPASGSESAPTPAEVQTEAQAASNAQPSPAAPTGVDQPEEPAITTPPGAHDNTGDGKPDDGIAAAAAAQPREEPDRSRDHRAGTSWSLVAASAGGAVLMAAILGALWVSGVVAPPNGAAGSTAQLGAIERQLRDLAARPATSPPAGDRSASDIAQRLAAIEQSLRGLQQIDQRLARAETTLAAPRPAPAPGPGPGIDAAVSDRITGIENAARGLAGQLTELRSRSEEALTAAREARTRAEAAGSAAAAQPAAEAADRADIDALATRLAQLEQTAKAVQDSVAKAAAGPPPADKAIRLAFTTSMLRGAVERGEPFATELAATKPLVADTKAIAALEPFAASGVPALSALQREFAKNESALLSAANPNAGEGGLIERLQANAERLVRVRPLDARAGDDAATVVARIEVELGRGDVAAAIEDVAKLPADSRRLAASWLTMAQARQAAIDAARSLASDALKSLGKAAP